MEKERLILDNLPSYNNCGNCQHNFLMRLFLLQDHWKKMSFNEFASGKCKGN